MKKIVILILVLVISWLFSLSGVKKVSADWWVRPTAQPTQPSFNRSLEPTTAVHPTVAPTSGPSQPTVAPTNAPTGGTPSGDGGGSSSGNPCDPGKSFVGPYCGWSPSTSSGGGGGGGGGESPRVGGPQVLGLSNTSSSDFGLSDIIFLAGILCLALYARSKVIPDSQLH